jgi:hypothetical protein
MINESKFSLGNKVIIDGCDKIVAIITAISFRKTGCKIEISYFNDGRLEECWIDEWRLSYA